MQIFALRAGETFMLEVVEHDNIESLKEKIEELLGYSVERQELLLYRPGLGGDITIILEDDRTLSYYNIQPWSEIH
eukprot:6895442-Heterocapsa_arctica.AAC.1